MSYTVLDVNDINLNDDGIFCKILLEMELTNFSINNTYNKSTFVQSVWFMFLVKVLLKEFILICAFPGYS